MTIKTSDSHPLYATTIDDSQPGHVLLTMAPGKQCAGAYAGGFWKRDVQKDLDQLVSAYNAGMLVCLLEDHELSSLKIPTLIAEASKRSMRPANHVWTRAAATASVGGGGV